MRRGRLTLSVLLFGASTVSAASLSAARPTHVDAERVASRLRAPDTSRVTIKVTGMFCASCEATVRTMLKRTHGVYSAVVDVKRGLAAVAYDPKQTTPRALADVINRLGYEATLPPVKKATAGAL